MRPCVVAPSPAPLSLEGEEAMLYSERVLRFRDCPVPLQNCCSCVKEIKSRSPPLRWPWSTARAQKYPVWVRLAEHYRGNGPR